MFLINSSLKKAAANSLAIVGVAVLAVSCGGEHNGDKSESTGTDSVVVDSSDVKAQKIFYSLPSPIEMASLIKKAGANYNRDILNPIENAKKYSTTQSRALNLGVYGADLSYTSIFDQTQESMFYLSCVKKLADAMGITNAFNETTVERMQANMNNQDSVLQIVSDSYMETDDYLKENERAHTSALVIAGGWIEGLYLATKVVENKNNEQLTQRIAEQKLSLNDLINLLESYPSDETLKSTLTDLKSLQSVYNKLTVTEGSAEATANASGVVTLGGSNKIEMNKEQLAEISKKVAEIRNNIIK